MIAKHVCGCELCVEDLASSVVVGYGVGGRWHVGEVCDGLKEEVVRSAESEKGFDVEVVNAVESWDV